MTLQNNMKKLLVGLFLFGFLTVGIQQVHASVLSDALLKIKSLQQEISQLKTVLKGTVAGIPEPPTLGNTTVTATATGVTISSSVASLGYPASLIARGTCFGLETQGPMSNCLNEGGKTSGPFTQTRTGLTPNTKYMAISYAVNETATNWSNTVSFTTPASATPIPGGWTDWVNSGSCTSNGQAQVRYCTNPAPLNGGSCTGLPTQQVSCAFSSVPTVSYPTSQSITENRAMLGATVTSNGYPMTILENGICFGTTLSAAPSKNKGDNCITSASQQTLIYATNLTPSTTYKFRGYATNATGTGYSQEGTFTTLAGVTPINGGWADWYNYGSCVNGLQTQIHSCTNPTPANGGAYCSGSSTQQISCSSPTPSITVLSPNNGTEVYQAGQQITVKWKSDNFASNLIVFIGIESLNGSMKDEITSTLNDGEEIVKLPLNNANGSPLSSGKYYKIYVALGGNPNLSDTSDNTFTINSSSATSSKPVISMPKATSVTSTSAVLSATITDSGSPSTLTERGICYGTTLSSTPSKNKGDDCYAVTTTSTMINATYLTPNTIYKFRGFAVNATGVGYSEEGTFKTLTSGTVTPSITVLSPNNGTEVYKPGQQIVVSWSSVNIPKDYYMAIMLMDDVSKIEYKDNGRMLRTINDGQEIFTIPVDNWDGTKLIDGKRYQIGIWTAMNEGSIQASDWSNNYFTITSTTNTCPAYVAPVTCPAFQTETIKDANGCIVKYQCKDMTKATEIIPTDGCSNGAIFNSITGARCTVDTKVCPASIPSETCPAYHYQEAIKDANGCVVRYQCKDISCTNGAIYSSRTGQLCSTSTVTAPYSNTTVQTPTTNDSTPAPSNNNTAPITRNLKRGVRGDDVRRVQEFLGIGADGVYGRGTTEAVRQWQIENGLKGDGIFGQGSYGKMLEELY